MAQGAKIRGASKIIGVDTNPEKYEKGMLSIQNAQQDYGFQNALKSC